MFLLNCTRDIIGIESFIRSSSISFQGSTWQYLRNATVETKNSKNSSSVQGVTW